MQDEQVMPLPLLLPLNTTLLTHSLNTTLLTHPQYSRHPSISCNYALTQYCPTVLTHSPYALTYPLDILAYLVCTTELVAAEEQELNVIQSYMPAQLGNNSPDIAHP